MRDRLYFAISAWCRVEINDTVIGEINAALPASSSNKFSGVIAEAERDRGKTLFGDHPLEIRDDIPWIGIYTTVRNYFAGHANIKLEHRLISTRLIVGFKCRGCKN